MRRQYLPWMILVIAILLVAYGGYFSIREFNGDNRLFIGGVVALSIGGFILILIGILRLISKKEKKDMSSKSPAKEYEEPAKPIIGPKEEKEPEPEPEPKSEPKPEEEISTRASYRDVDREVVRSRYTSSYDSSGYVKMVGYGPVLDIRGNRIRDMRDNTYYRIESNFVYSDSGGLMFEINGNRIRSAFAGPLFEVSGNRINKVFGGFYASYDGNRIQKHDLSEIYEVTTSLNRNQLLLVSVLLFGSN